MIECPTCGEQLKILEGYWICNNCFYRCALTRQKSYHLPSEVDEEDLDEIEEIDEEDDESEEDDEE